MSLYDGLSVETAPVPELMPQPEPVAEEEEEEEKVDSGWTANLKLMATQLQHRRGEKTARGRGRPRVPSNRASALRPSSRTGPVTVQTPAIRPAEMLVEDDLAGEVADEYDPMFPSNYEDIKKEEREKEEKDRDEERLLRKMDRERERMQRRRHHDTDSDEEREERRRRKQLASIPPPSSLTTPSEPPASDSSTEDEGTSSQMVYSALEQLSKIKAQKKNTIFSKPFKTSAVASNIMSKYGWKEGQGLGKTSQGISTALQVQKTGFRGGKIVDLAAEQKMIAEADKKKTQSLASVMKNPTKVVLLTNMVGPGEVDDDLQPEVIEETSKYGEVKKCLIFEMPPGGPEEEAVRIFVQFAKVESAIKAVIDLNGRYFGGRVVKGSFFSEDRFDNFDLAPLPDS